MATLKDIAQLVGVSISTVSRVLKNEANRSVSQETKQKIWNAAQEVGYSAKEPAAQAAPVAKGIGCIVSTMQNKHYHPYFSVIFEGIERELAKHGYELTYTYTMDDLRNPAVLQKAVHDSRVEGVIVVEGIDSKIYSQLKKHIRCIVGIDTTDHTVPNISYDRVEAARIAVSHLIEQGHRDIVFIGGTGLSGNFEKEKRFRGYKAALEQAGLELKPQWIVNANWDPTTSYELMLAFLDRHKEHLPTAIFAASDIMAMAAMRAVAEKGYRIPHDIGIIGFDDNEPSQFTVPPLSTIHIPTFEIGIIAARTMVNALQDPYPLPIKVTVPFELKARQSTDFRVTSAEG